MEHTARTKRSRGEILQHGYNEYSTNVITTDYQTTIKVRRPLDIPLKLNQAILGVYITDVSRWNSILLKKKIFERKTFRLERPQRP